MLKITNLHKITLILMVLTMLIGCYVFVWIDAETLKPTADFPPFLKTISQLTNGPIKIGILHFVFYAIEFFFFPEIVSIHVGQRLTTLWLQYFENPRWGQHLHMQIELTLQLCDAYDRSLKVKPERLQAGKKYLWTISKAFAMLAYLIMFVTNFLTSSAYHTAFEQMIGLVIAVAKISFDYTQTGQQVSLQVGSSLTEVPEVAIAAGTLVLFLAYVLLILLGIHAEPVLLHPTVLATTLYIGGQSRFLLYD